MNRRYESRATEIPLIAARRGVAALVPSVSREPTVKPQNAAAETGTIPESQTTKILGLLSESHFPKTTNDHRPPKTTKNRMTGSKAAIANQPAAINRGSNPSSVLPSALGFSHAPFDSFMDGLASTTDLLCN